MRRKLLWVGLPIVLAAGVWAGFKLRHPGAAHAGGNLPSAPVRRGDFAELVRCRGEITARRSVQLSAPMNIPDLKIVWTVPPGSQVKAGDTVIRFDPSGAKRQLDEKSAALRQAQATLDQAIAQTRTTAEQDKLDLATARYEVERARLEASKQAIVSVLQGESSKIDLATAEAKMRVQVSTIEAHQRADEAKSASLTRQKEKAQADVDLLKARMAEMNIVSPLNGAISFLTNRSQGWMNTQPFKVGDAVWPGAAIAEIPDPTTLRMQGKLDEVDRGRVQPGNEVRIKVDALPEREFHGKLESFSPLTEMSWEWPPVRSFIAYAPIADPDPRLRTSMNAGLDIVIRHIPDALSVSAKAIFTRNSKPVVFVAENKQYRPVEIEVIARNPDEVAIRGVRPGVSVSLVDPDGDKESQAK